MQPTLPFLYLLFFSLQTQATMEIHWEIIGLNLFSPKNDSPQKNETGCTVAAQIFPEVIKRIAVYHVFVIIDDKIVSL